MFENFGRSVVLVGGAAGLTLCLAGGVALGVVPHAGVAATADASPTSLPSGPAPTTAPPPPGTAAPATAVAPKPAPVAPAPVTTTARAPRTRAVAAPTATASGPSAAPVAAPTGPTLAPRLNPGSAAVQAAMASLKARNPMYASLTEAQARQFGDQVCSAFDAGQTGAQVRATAAQAAAKVPFVSVSAADVSFAVRTAVQLFCPGYLSRLS